MSVIKHIEAEVERDACRQGHSDGAFDGKKARIFGLKPVAQAGDTHRFPAVNLRSGCQPTFWRTDPAYRCDDNRLKIDTSAELSSYVTPG